jgi:Ca2+-binding RTX toxin-like protein
LPGTNDPIGILTSTDADGETLTWSVEGSSGFRISSSGVLTRDGGLSFDQSYTFDVFANDFSSSSIPLAIRISVGSSSAGIQADASDVTDLVYAASSAVNVGLGDDTVFGSNTNGPLTGGPGNDVMYGAGGNDEIEGGPGLDKLFGGDGADTLYGEEDTDTLSGGLGNDTLDGGLGDNDFVFDTALGPTNVDRIVDFNQDNDEDDRIILDNDIFTAFGTRIGALSTTDFQEYTVTSSALQSQVLSGNSPRIVVNLRTGGLADVYYDADGGSLSNATLFATVDYGTADKPRYNDFQLID